jgi:DNA-binding response OmpR family regulator
MKKVLVVDDDAAILEAIQVSLELEDYAVCTATNGQMAIQIAKDEQPQLIILDVLLSGSDGRDIARMLKKLPETELIPIVMVSAHQNIRESVIDAGADDFLPKPFNIDDLLTLASQYTSLDKSN